MVCIARTAMYMVRNQAETAEDTESMSEHQHIQQYEIFRSTSEHQRIQQYAIFRFNF